jgi:membrane protein YqaA with SNARE-associated domain
LLAAFVTTFGYCILSALIPVLNSEIYVLAAAAVAPQAAPAVVIGAALGQMVGKSALYLAGSGSVLLPGQRLRKMVDAVREKYQHGAAAPALGGSVLLASAVVGLPPFYIVSVACGIFRIPYLHFFVIGLVGMLVRYGVLVLAPQLVRAVTG